MSFGSFELIGDEYPMNGQVYESRDQKENYFFSCNGGPKRLSYAVYEALIDLDDQIDYSQYDNDGPDGVPNSGDDDGYVDFIVMWFRFHMAACTDGSGYSGIANLTGFNTEFVPGVSEIATKDVGSNGESIKIRPNSGIIGEGLSDKGINIFAHEIGHQIGFSHDPWQGYFSMMTWEGMGIMNSWERKQLNWISNYINISSSVYNYPLRDFETYGDAIKINITGNENYYLVENRQRIKYYSSNQWIVPDEGLIINKCEQNSFARIQCADHKWNFESNNGIYTYPYKKLAPNNSGLFEMDIFGGGSPYTNICVNLPGTACGSYDQKYHPDAHGDSKDLWDIGYNQVFSPWSNPQSSISNLGIELKSKDLNGTMYLDIVFENPQQLSPSKPLWLRVTPEYFDPLVIHKFHPRLEWLPNSEPDMTNYKIYRGVDAVNPTYYEIATVSSSVSTFIDEQLTMYDGQDPTETCDLDKVAYVYKITAIDNQNLESVKSDSSRMQGFENNCYEQNLSKQGVNNLPQKFSIFNYPNPFNPSTQIKYELPKSSFVTIKIYNAIGEEVAKLINEFKSSGSYSVTFDGSNFGSGIYFYSIEAGQFKETKKMVLIK
jgi:M6 family metalloprotease-like protein